MFKAIKKLFSGRRVTQGSLRARASDDEIGPWTLRRWEAAETNRLNSGHWSKVTGQSINLDLMQDLERLRTRTANEVSNNPTLAGVIHTYKTDVGGRDGPDLQVQCDGDEEEWAAALEAVWWQHFWKNPDIAGKLDGVEWIKLNCNSMFVNGEFLTQKVTSLRAVQERQPITMRLKTIHPRRLGTPAMSAGDPDVVLGIRQTPEGEPLQYMISEPSRMGPFMIDNINFKPVPASSIIHRYVMLEEDQARGVPWLATPLQSAADGHDFDAQVMDAARAAADNAAYLSTDHIDAPFVDLGNESVPVERRTLQTLPPGWKYNSTPATQPMPNYVEFRGERQRDLGRPIGMPLMMIRLDSSGHNYSSARFDGQIYWRGVSAFQGWLERRTLNDLVEDVRREAQLYALANPRWEYAILARKVKYDCVWTWPVPPNVDPNKEANGQRTKLQNGTLTFSGACAMEGTDEDTVIASRVRTNKKLAKAGLPPLPPLADWGSNNGQMQSGADLQTISDLRDAADAAEEKGDTETADSLNAQADALEKSGQSAGGGGQNLGSAAAAGPAGLNGAQITAMTEVVSSLSNGSMAAGAATELLIAGGISEEAAARIVKATPVVEKDVNAEQKAFEREVVKTFLADKTVADVFYNATDIPHLLTDVGLKLDPDVERDNSNAIPFLPVIADPGQLVNGGVIKDDQNKIVGGDVEDPPAQPGVIAGSGDAAGAKDAAKESKK